MTPAEFRTLRTALGLTCQQVARIHEVNLRSVQRWEVSRTPPDDVAAWLLDRWHATADRVGDVLDLAEKDELKPLIAYRHDSQCEHLGMTASEHAALLGHICMALTQCDYDFEIVES